MGDLIKIETKRGVVVGPKADPVTVAITASLVNAGVSAAIASFIATAVVNTVISVALNALTGALTKKPKPPASSNFTAQLRDRTLTARQPIAPRRIIYGAVRVGGVYTFIHTTGSSNEFINLVVTLSGHEIEAVDGLFFDGVEVPLDGNGDATGDFAGFVHMETNLGTETQTAFPGLVAEAPTKWTANHRQLGCAGVYVRLKYDADKFPNGIPNMTWAVRGKADVFDPRTSTTGYSNNAALCNADYISLPRLGLGAVYSTEILDADLIEAANICDEAVALDAGGTEPRYECNGTLETDSTPFENIKSLTGAMGGAAITQGKLWTFRAGAYRAPEISALTEGDFVGAISTQTLFSRTQSFNGVKGVFTSPENSWQPDDFPAVQVASYVTADNGEEVWAEVTLPFTTSVTAAQRISRMMLELQRRQITVKVPCKMVAYKLQPFDTVPFTIPRYGWTDKTFQVKKMQLVMDKAWSINLDTQEVDAAAYAWSTTDEGVYTPDPTTDLPNPFDVLPPTLVVSDTLVLLNSGDISTNLVATLTAPADAFIVDYEVQFKLSTDSTWDAMGKGDGLVFKTSNVEDLLSYNVRARSVTASAVRSAWVTSAAHEVLGKSAPPENVTGFVASQNGNVVTFLWNQVSDVDLAGYEIRYAPQAGFAWGSAIVATSITKGTLISNTAIPPGDWTLAIKAVDTSGNYSTTEATHDLTVSQVNTTVDSISHIDPWAGTTLTDLIRHRVNGRLVPDSQDIASASGWDTFDVFVPNPVALAYLQGAELDAGFDSSDLRLWGTTTATLGPGETGVADPRLEMKYKPDAGVYSAWQEWTVGTVPLSRFITTRSKIDTSTGVPYITQFTSTLDEEEDTKTGSGEAISIGGTTVSFASSFHTAPIVSAWAEGSTPLIVQVFNVTATGFDAKVFNTSASDVGGTISYSARGV